MIKGFLFFSCCLVLNLGLAQGRAIEVLNEIYCIGVIGCRPNTTVRIDLPPNTDQWFYTATATKSPQVAQSIVNSPAIFSIFPDIQIKGRKKKKRKIGNAGPAYTGDGNCSVYLLKTFSDTEKFTTPGAPYFFHRDYSRKNVPLVGMAIENPDLCKGAQFIGIENSRSFQEQVNVYVVLTVIALTKPVEK